MENRIFLRALEPDDYKVSINWRKDESIWEMLGGTKYFVSEAYEKKWVEETIFSSKDVKLAICLIETGKYIGNIYMTNINQIYRSCHSHVLIGDKAYWGKEYAREAMMKAMEYMFFERNIHCIRANVLEGNKQSLRMLEKCGFKIEGMLRDAVYKTGRYQNQYVLSILRDEFSQAQDL